MKKLTAILIALGASAGLAFGKIVYEDKLASSVAPVQTAQEISSVDDRASANSQAVADNQLVNQLNHRVAYQLEQMTLELDHKIVKQMKPYAL